MKLKDLKMWLESLPEAELEKELVYNCMEYGITGPVADVEYADQNLYFTGDGPAVLYTERELKMQGFTKHQIEDMDVEVPKGHYYIELHNEYSILNKFSC